MNELGYSFNSVITNQVEFPKDTSARLAYAQVIKESVNNLGDLPLKKIEELSKAVESQVGKTRLKKGQTELSRPCTRFYLWIQKHTGWDLPLKIITLGITGLVAHVGKASYEKRAPLIDLAESVSTLKSTLDARKNEVEELESSILSEVHSNKRSLEKLVVDLQVVSSKRGELKEDFFKSVQKQLISAQKSDLSNPTTYTDERRYTALTKLYEFMKCPNQLESVKHGKEVYSLNARWNELDNDQKIELLQTMKKDSERFKPLLEKRIESMQKALVWDVFSASTPLDRQMLIEQSCTLMEGLPMADTLEDRINDLSEQLQKVGLKQCNWQDPVQVAHIESICQDLGMTAEFILASCTYNIEKNWPQTPLDVRLQNTEELVSHATYYDKELDRRRLELFGSLEDLSAKPTQEFEYTVKMLQALKPVFQQGCTQMLKSIKAEFLTHMKSAWANEELRQELIDKALIIGVDARIIDDITDSGTLSSLWKYVQTGMRQEQRIAQNVQSSLLWQQQELRRMGTATPIDHVPRQDEFAALKTTQEHFNVVPPSVPQFKGRANVLQLMEHLKEADKLGLIPEPLRELSDGGQVILHAKRKVTDALDNFLYKLERGHDLGDRLERVNQVLRHYTAQVNERLAACRSKEEKREIYNEVVELVGKEIGFACFHCQDRKYNAAMAIYNEKIASLSQESETTPKKVHFWLAKKRDELVTQMLQEMIQESINSTFGMVDQDVASAVGRWRYVLRGKLGLGDVPAPQYSHLHGGFSEAQILSRFKATYTPAWILQQAMDEYDKKNGTVVMKWPAINEFLGARIKNYDDIQEGLLDEETYKLLVGGMALYLQETGVFDPIV